jgi:hypothetical protein
MLTPQSVARALRSAADQKASAGKLAFQDFLEHAQPAPLWQTTLRSLGEAADMPRRAVFNTVFQPQNGERGVGDLAPIAHSNLPMWLKRTAGFMGDVVTDPLAWLPGAAEGGEAGAGLEQFLRNGERAATRTLPAASEGLQEAARQAATQFNIPRGSWTKDTAAELVPTDFLQRFQEFNRFDRPIRGHSEQSLADIAKTVGERGFDEPAIIYLNPETKRALLAEGNHRLSYALKEGLKEMPARVARVGFDEPHWQQLEDLLLHPDESGYFPADLRPSHVFPELAQPRAVGPQEFSDALARAMQNLGDRAGFLTPYSPEELAARDAKLFLSHGGDVGGALYRNAPGDIEIGSLFNAGGPKGSGTAMLNALKNKGGNYLEAFDSLKPVYERAGFNETSRSPWNPEFAPPDWNYEKYGTPDYLRMDLQAPSGAAPTAKELEQQGARGLALNNPDLLLRLSMLNDRVGRGIAPYLWGGLEDQNFRPREPEQMRNFASPEELDALLRMLRGRS